MNHVSDSVTFSRDLSLDLFKHILYVSPHPPCVDTGAVAEERPDDGDDALLRRQVERRPPLAILLAAMIPTFLEGASKLFS